MSCLIQPLICVIPLIYFHAYNLHINTRKAFLLWPLGSIESVINNTIKVSPIGIENIRIDQTYLYKNRYI